MERADKVATRVGYSKTKKDLKNWAFESFFGDEGIDVREQFKLTLDEEYENDRGFTVDNARLWYYDYLTCLHREIEKFFDSSVPRWRNLHVGFNFSTPTTWKNPAMIASIEKLIRSAGFASTSNQTVRMALTEAEAAAIEASTTQYRLGDVFLICDVCLLSLAMSVTNTDRPAVVQLTSILWKSNPLMDDSNLSLRSMSKECQ
jgi:hypothetical protein